MDLFIACDHAGVNLKNYLISSFDPSPLIWNDLGVHDSYNFDQNRSYPEMAKLLAGNIESGKGILICGSGIGMSIAANRFKHIRAALCRSLIDVSLARLHNDANVLCLGSRLIDERFAVDLVKVFLTTEFESGRHRIRVEKLETLVD